MGLFFLQVLLDSAKIRDSLERVAQVAAQQKESLWDIFQRGGPLMIPLACLLVLAIFFFIERLMAINKASKVDENFMNIIRDQIVSGNVTAARKCVYSFSDRLYCSSVWIFGNDRGDVSAILRHCFHRRIQYFQYCRRNLCKNDLFGFRPDYRDHCLCGISLPQFTD